MTTEPGDVDVDVGIGQLFDEHAADLGRYLARRIGSHPAEDLLSETFGIALARWDSYTPGPGGRQAWLFGIATNLLRRHLRAEERHWRAVDRAGRGVPTLSAAADAGVPERVDAQRTTRDLARAIRALAPEDREVLLLSAWAHLSPTEIADSLGIPAGTARSRLHRVRRLLKGALAELDGDPS